MIAQIDKLQEEIAAEEKRLVTAISQKLGEAFIDEIGDELDTIRDAAGAVNGSVDKLKKQIDACDDTAEKVSKVVKNIEGLPVSIANAQTAINEFTSQFVDMAEQSKKNVRDVREMNGQLVASLQSLLTEAERSEEAAKEAVGGMQELYGQAARICDDFINLKKDNHHKIAETTDALTSCAVSLNSFRVSCEEAEKASVQYREVAVSGAAEIRKASLEETERMVQIVRSITEQLSGAVDTYNAQLKVVSQDFAAAYQTLRDHSNITDANIQKIEQLLLEETARNVVREKENQKKFWISTVIGAGVLVLQLLQMILH